MVLPQHEHKIALLAIYGLFIYKPLSFLQQSYVVVFQMEEYNIPKPGGKVLLHKKMCKFAGARYQSHAHEHVKYQMVYKIEGFDQMKKTRTIVDTFTGFLTKKAQRVAANAAVLGQL